MPATSGAGKGIEWVGSNQSGRAVVITIIELVYRAGAAADALADGHKEDRSRVDTGNNWLILAGAYTCGWFNGF